MLASVPHFSAMPALERLQTSFLALPFMPFPAILAKAVLKGICVKAPVTLLAKIFSRSARQLFPQLLPIDCLTPQMLQENVNSQHSRLPEKSFTERSGDQHIVCPTSTRQRHIARLRGRFVADVQINDHSVKRLSLWRVSRHCKGWSQWQLPTMNPQAWADSVPV